LVVLVGALVPALLEAWGTFFERLDERLAS
jgi:hypothetical protein